MNTSKTVMNLVDVLGSDRSKTSIVRLSKAIAGNPEMLKEIVRIIYSENAPLPLYASRVLTDLSEKHPQLIRPYVSRLINTVRDFKVSGVKRHILRTLATQEIPHKLQGKMVSICFDFILDASEPVAVKVFALEILSRLSAMHPGLKSEIRAAIMDQLPKTSAAFHSRAKKVLKKMEKGTGN